MTRREPSSDQWPSVPVFFATTDGHTARVAARIAGNLRENGAESDSFDLSKEAERERSWDRVSGVILCTSVDLGVHQRSARLFATAHRDRLSQVTSLSVWVCLAIRPPRTKEQDAAEKVAHSFGNQTGWVADRTVFVAGCVAAPRDGWLRRLLKWRASSANGNSTETSGDGKSANWAQVDRLADEFSRSLAPWTS